MSLTDTVFGSPGQTQIHQTNAMKPPGFNFAKNFFNQLPGLTSNPYPTYQGNLDPGMSPTMQDAIRRAQGYAQSSPAEILQGVQGMAGQFMSPNFANPWNSLFGGAANYGGVNGAVRGYGGQPMQNMTFQSGLSQAPMQGQNGSNGGMGGGQYGGIMAGQQGQPQMAMRAMNATTGQSGGFQNGQWQPNPGQGMQQMNAQAGTLQQRGPLMPPGGQGNAGPYGGIMGGQPGQGGGGMTWEDYSQPRPRPSQPMSVPDGPGGGFQDALNMNFNDAQGALSRMFAGDKQGLNSALAGQYGMNQFGQQSDGRNQFMHSTDHQSALRQLLGREPTFNEVQESLRNGSANIEAARTSFMQEAPASASAGWSNSQKDLSSLINQFGMAKGTQMFNQQAGDGPMWAGGGSSTPQPPISPPGFPAPPMPMPSDPMNSSPNVGPTPPPSGGIRMTPPVKDTLGKLPGQSPTDKGVMKPIPDRGGIRNNPGIDVRPGIFGKPGGRGINKPDVNGLKDGMKPRPRQNPNAPGGSAGVLDKYKNRGPKKPGGAQTDEVLKKLPPKKAPTAKPPAVTDAQVDMLKAYL